jgi:uncharacterized lipoprotein YddW (UPF0748 family)
VKLGRRGWLWVLFGITVVLAVLLSGWSGFARIDIQQVKSSAFAASVPQEIRGVWLTNIDSDVLYSPDNLSQGLERLSRMNFNTVYPTVWNWGYTLYPSRVAEPVTGRKLDPYPGLQGRDILAEILEKAHEQDLTVIPWFEFGLMAPSYSVLAQRHPDWITQRQDGSTLFMQGRHPRVWLNPLHPEVQQFMVDLVTEVVTTYDVDGIQFDDHFGLPVEFGYDPHTLQQYQQEHQGQLPPVNDWDPEWVRWRANKITALMTRIFYAVKSRRPNCLISLSPNPWEFSYQFYLQDWRTWERLGFIEELIVQVYRSGLEGFIRELERPEVLEARSHIPVGIGILTGLKHQLAAMEQIQAQVNTVRDRQFAGVSFFFYESLGDRDLEFQVLFGEPAGRP